MELIRTYKNICFMPFWLFATALCIAQDPPADPNQAVVSASAKNSASNTIAETPTTMDPNQPQTPAKEDAADPFNIKTSSLVLIQEAYQKILNPELVTQEGRVAYATLRRKRSNLMTAAKELESLNPAVLMSLSREERIAFWINTYNVCMIKLIVDRYPIEPKWYMILYPDDSIMQIQGAWTTIYFDIQKLEYNLKEIEQAFLINSYKDPRICFALSYASMGGATLRNEPYQGDRIEEQLNDQVKRYLYSPKGMKLDRDNDILYLSNLFMMHKKTFLDSEYAAVLKFRDRKPEERAWLNFILPHLEQKDQNYIENNKVTIQFIEYDWHLNDSK